MRFIPWALVSHPGERKCSEVYEMANIGVILFCVMYPISYFPLLFQVYIIISHFPAKEYGVTGETDNFTIKLRLKQS